MTALQRAVSRRDPRGSRRRWPELLYRHRQWLGAEQRRDAGRAEAAGGPQADHPAGDRTAAGPRGASRRRARLLHADSRIWHSACRTARRAISTRSPPAIRATLPQWADRMRRAMADLKGTLTDVINSNENRRAAGRAGDRPRARRGDGRDAAGSGQHAVRCVRPATDPHDLPAAQLLARGAGGGAGNAGRSCLAEHGVRAGHRRRAGAAGGTDTAGA